MVTPSIMSLTVKGLNTLEKRRILLQDLKWLGVVIAFLQETHFRENSLPLLRNRAFPMAYHATNPVAKKRGLSILISSKIQWSCSESLVDTWGQYLFLKGKMGGKGSFGHFLSA